MDVIFLSRLQFAIAAIFHFIFVPLTLGLSVIVAYMETRYVRTKDIMYLSMTKFWGNLFLINFAIGVVTGITLEFQFGTNWSRYSSYVGDIFGPLLAIEATTAFFLESTFIGVWIFGWKKLSKKVHCCLAWLIAFSGNLSAFWILMANAWMQNPVGYVINNDRAELINFISVITNKVAILEILHTIPASFLLSSFFVMGISAWYLLKNKKNLFFYNSFKIGLKIGLVSSILVLIFGDLHAANVAKIQPLKLAAMEAHWETQKRADLSLFAIPDELKEKNRLDLFKIPYLLSFLSYRDIDSEVKGLKVFSKEERPPVFITFFAFRIMVVLGFLFIFLTSLGTYYGKKIIKNVRYLKIMFFSMPLPYIAIEMGWILAEVGRQPWIVYGLMKTTDAVSPIAVTHVLVSIIGFLLIYGFIGILWLYFLIKEVRKGPDSFN